MDGILIVVGMLGLLASVLSYRFGYSAGYSDAMKWSCDELEKWAEERDG